MHWHTIIHYKPSLPNFKPLNIFITWLSVGKASGGGAASGRYAAASKSSPGRSASLPPHLGQKWNLCFLANYRHLSPSLRCRRRELLRSVQERAVLGHVLPDHMHLPVPVHEGDENVLQPLAVLAAERLDLPGGKAELGQ